MFVQLSIHRVRPGQEEFLIDSMHRFGNSIKSQPGLQSVFTLKDPKTGNLVGLAIWDSEESMIAARPLMAEAVKDDDFEAWEEAGSPTTYRLEEV